ncbi:DUF3969 family protein [Kiloniella laminariae]|uniref:DUF3969 family protein n=1 Tax=Kiloniella laminariae TaxID=454162 RepID=UPI000381F2D1|nr:DUF3969 family protein [Kiloniella laminariae]
MMNSAEKNYKEKLMLIFSVGLCECLEAGVIEIVEAERLLYSPRVMDQLEEFGFSKGLINLIHMGTELEDIESLLPENLEEEFQNMKNHALKKLKKKPEVDYEITRWTEKFIG